MDLYLSEEYHKDWLEIIRLSKLEDTDSIHKLTRYIMEAMRITSSAAGVSRVCAKDIVVADGDRKVACSAGDMVFIDLVFPKFSLF
jgi:cytochrome P450